VDAWRNWGGVVGAVVVVVRELISVAEVEGVADVANDATEIVEGSCYVSLVLVKL
jgi:hypothetical protein